MNWWLERFERLRVPLETKWDGHPPNPKPPRFCFWQERLSLKIQETQGSVTNNYSVDLTQLKDGEHFGCSPRLALWSEISQVPQYQTRKMADGRPFRANPTGFELGSACFVPSAGRSSSLRASKRWSRRRSTAGVDDPAFGLFPLESSTKEGALWQTASGNPFIPDPSLLNSRLTPIQPPATNFTLP